MKTPLKDFSNNVIVADDFNLKNKMQENYGQLQKVKHHK